ncbi:MAG: hypothetical protein WCK09_21925 [Bacteroidota bacterium]
MKQIYLLIAFAIILYSTAFGQVGINTDNSSPDPSAGLDVKFNNKGFLPPRMNSIQRNAIVSPAAGLMIFNHCCPVKPELVNFFV